MSSEYSIALSGVMARPSTKVVRHVISPRLERAVAR